MPEQILNSFFDKSLDVTLDQWVISLVRSTTRLSDACLIIEGIDGAGKGILFYGKLIANQKNPSKGEIVHEDRSDIELSAMAGNIAALIGDITKRCFLSWPANDDMVMQLNANIATDKNIEIDFQAPTFNSLASSTGYTSFTWAQAKLGDLILEPKPRIEPPYAITAYKPLQLITSNNEPQARAFRM